MIYMYHNKKNRYENFDLPSECYRGNAKWNHCNNSLITNQKDYSRDWWEEGQGCYNCPRVDKGKKLDGIDIGKEKICLRENDGCPEHYCITEPGGLCI